jgi:dipeptidyl-peptidase-4
VSFAQIAPLPRPGGQSRGGGAFRPASSPGLYLGSSEYGSLSRQLYATDVATGETRPLACTPPGTGEEENLSLEEKLRRERARIMNTGVTSFKIAGPEGSAGRVLVPMGGALYIRDGLDEKAELKRIFDPQVLGSGPILDPQISEDGSLVCFVWKDEVYCVPADGSQPPRALTSGSKKVTNGLADFLAQEELDRYEGFWVSPDATQVAWEEVDESHIPQFRIMHSGADSVGEGAQEDHRYPFAGEPNPKVKLFVTSTTASGADLPGGVPKPIPFELTGPFGEDFYLARVQWLPNGNLVAQVLNREQTELAVLHLDLATQAVTTLWSEKTGTWINVHDMLRPIGKTGKLLWANERTGFRHLSVYDPESGGLKALTSGEWQVEEVNAIDEAAGLIYFSGTSEGKWLERHLFRVALDGSSPPEQVTTEPGMHGVTIDPKKTCFVDIMSSVDKPAVATLRSLSDGGEIHTIFKNEDPLIDQFAVPPPEFVTFPSMDGKVTLQAALYKPDPKVYGPGPYPTVVSCYGGPHVQFVSNSWSMTVDLRAQAMCSRGCLVVKVDNRGSNRRGLDFEAPVKHDMGNIEVEDQAAGVRWAVAEGLADESRVGIYGWSYGGYLSAICLAKAPGVFKCAVSGAPVTSWDGYDTCYTERYMGTPESSPKGYKSSSVMEFVDGMKGDLLLVHGLIDENVHFRHTARLINALIAAQKPYQLLLFPNERHSPRSQKDREYMEERIWAFIKQSLQA